MIGPKNGETNGESWSKSMGNPFFWGFIWTIIHHYSPFNAGGVPWELKKGNGIYLDCSHDRDATMG